MDNMDSAAYIGNSEKRFSVSYALSPGDYLTFNRFIFESTGMLRKSRGRMKWMSIAELLLAVGVLIVALLTGKAEPLYFLSRRCCCWAGC